MPPAGHESYSEDCSKRLSYTDDDIVWPTPTSADCLSRTRSRFIFISIELVENKLQSK